jgi:hypothetical protein
MDESTRSDEQWKVDAALRDLAQNLLRCLSGGDAGKWNELMPSIYKAAIADQDYRAKTGHSVPDEALKSALEWEMDYWKQREGMAADHRLHLDAEHQLERAFSSALRIIAYKISGTPRALQDKAKRDFLARLEAREAALKAYRNAR